MNTTEANTVARVLRGDETAEDRQFLAERAGKALQLSPLGLLAAHRPISHVLAGIDHAVAYCREHGTRADECGCACGAHEPNGEQQ